MRPQSQGYLRLGCQQRNMTYSVRKVGQSANVPTSTQDNERAQRSQRTRQANKSSAAPDLVLRRWHGAVLVRPCSRAPEGLTLGRAALVRIQALPVQLPSAVRLGPRDPVDQTVKSDNQLGHQVRSSTWQWRSR